VLTAFNKFLILKGTSSCIGRSLWCYACYAAGRFSWGTF